MDDYEAYFRQFPPEQRRHERLIQAAKLETQLMVEFLAEARPAPEDSTWVRNAPRGPSSRGIDALREVQERYGACNVTTGNASPQSVDEVGIYVRSDVLVVATLLRYLCEEG